MRGSLWIVVNPVSRRGAEPMPGLPLTRTPEPECFVRPPRRAVGIADRLAAGATVVAIGQRRRQCDVVGREVVAPPGCEPVAPEGSHGAQHTAPTRSSPLACSPAARSLVSRGPISGSPLPMIHRSPLRMPPGPTDRVASTRVGIVAATSRRSSNAMESRSFSLDAGARGTVCLWR